MTTKNHQDKIRCAMMAMVNYMHKKPSRIRPMIEAQAAAIISEQHGIKQETILKIWRCKR